MFSYLLVFLTFGVFAGLLAGLLGVGGGTVIVPVITSVFEHQGVATDKTQLIAVATSLAIISITSISSFVAHHRAKMVCWKVVFKITPGIILGTFCGTKIAPMLPNELLAFIFFLFLLYVATSMFFPVKKKFIIEKTVDPNVTVTTKEKLENDIDDKPLKGNWIIDTLAGLAIGMFSSFVGIGGGMIVVPYLSWRGFSFKEAIGTSAAISFPIAFSGTIGYLVEGWKVLNLPQYTFGYIYLPALLGITVAGVICAPIGAKLTRTLPVFILKRYFGAFLYIVAAKMAFSLFIN